MRIVRALISPWGILGLTLLGLAFGFVAVALDQADVKIPALVYVFGILAGVSFLGAMAALIAALFGSWVGPWVEKLKRVRPRWPFYIRPTEAELAEQWEAQRFGMATVEREEPTGSQMSHGIPEDMVAQRHIRYHPSPIRLADLLEVAGEDGVLRDFTFEHCILEGPGIINLGGPFPKPETTGSGPRGSLTVGPMLCRVEGSPDTVLYEITPGGKIPIGVIHLAGYTIRNVTFRGLGFAGTPDELQRLKKHLTFSEGNAAPASSPTEELNRSVEEYQNLRDQRRKRIEEWRSAIRNHQFGDYPRFASTVAYSQMRPYLRPEVIEMLEAPRTFHVGNEARGDSAYRTALLDEVARIEKEWGLI